MFAFHVVLFVLRLILFQGVAYVKHLLDQSSQFLSTLKAPLPIQVAATTNKATAVEMKVDLLAIRVDSLESKSEWSQAVFEEEQDGRINIE